LPKDMMMSLPKVQLSRLLTSDLTAVGDDSAELAKYFAEWKATGSDGEFTDWYFGKDGFYAEPKRHGRMVLKHVHLPPESDAAAMAEWERKHELGSRKISDAALIYAHDPSYGYLLLAIVREPDGHLLSQMSTPETTEFMNLLADAAEEFIYFGKIGL
jgi:hypothetical protein